MLIVIAGHETTANVIGNTLHALVTHPHEMAKVIDQSTLLPSAIEEALRLETPVPLGVRVATSDVEIAGREIAAGTFVYVLFGAANRDEAAFASPDDFDVTRDTNGHLGFGRGSHYCLGVHLARLEAQTALGAVLERRPRLAPDTVARWRDTFATRGIESLRVVLEHPA